MAKETKKYSVLIFEDDMDLARQWTQILEKNSMSVKHAMTVDAAETYCSQIKFDVIIIDVFIKDPSGNLVPRAGYTLLSYMRNTSLEKIPKWGGTVPIIVVTGSPTVNGYDPLSYAMSMGANGTLRKPFKPEELYFKILILLDLK